MIYTPDSRVLINSLDYGCLRAISRGIFFVVLVARHIKMHSM